MHEIDELQKIANDLQYQLIVCTKAYTTSPDFDEQNVWWEAIKALRNELNDIKDQIFLLELKGK